MIEQGFWGWQRAVSLLGGELHDGLELAVDHAEKVIKAGVAGGCGQQMRGHDNLAALASYRDVARHVRHGRRGDFQHSSGQGQTAELNGVVIGKRDVVAGANHAADMVMAGDTKVLFGDSYFQFRQHIAVRLGSFHFVERILRCCSLARATDQTDSDGKENETSQTIGQPIFPGSCPVPTCVTKVYDREYRAGSSTNVPG